MPIITKLTLQQPTGSHNAHLMSFEAEFSASSDPAGAKLNLSATIPNDPKITIGDLQKKSLDMLFEILKGQFVTNANGHAANGSGMAAHGANGIGKSERA